jgi:hypothetical protein
MIDNIYAVTLRQRIEAGRNGERINGGSVAALRLLPVRLT